MNEMIFLPLPPPVNNLFATVGKRRIRSRRYEAWLKQAGLMLAAQRPVGVPGPFVATLVFTRPDQRRRDLDGLAKAPLDLMVRHGVIRDDSDCQALKLEWRTPTWDKPGGLWIMLEAA